MARTVQDNKTEKELDRYLERFAELEKEKERVLAQYKKYLDVINSKKRHA